MNHDDICLAACVRRIHRSLIGFYDRRLRPLGLTVAQLDVLESIAARPAPIRHVDLAAAMGMDPSTVSRNLALLAKAGLVSSRPGDARREVQVELTGPGHELVAEARPVWAEAQQTVKRELGPAGVSAIHLLYTTITDGKGHLHAGV